MGPSSSRLLIWAEVAPTSEHTLVLPFLLQALILYKCQDMLSHCEQTDLESVKKPPLHVI